MSDCLFDSPLEQPKAVREWSPYENNGGTALALSGSDFAIVASDTRISTGYSINTRYGTKVKQLTSFCAIATSGMLADQLALHKNLEVRMVQYKQYHRKEMPTRSVAQLLSNMLYYKRFFPYYTFNVVGGIDADGKGAVYGYDAVGSFEQVPAACSGTGHELIQPILDNQIDRQHQTGKSKWDISVEDAVALVKDCFTSAGERDIYTGDSVDLLVIDKNGVHFENFELKRD
ncbi:proteasome subunit beta type-1-like [Schistocerca gregaria]|uniref:proteasome subunit beta type-1-like n=1 Tax=Schistocerca gregaria TaxID=7010 RepID=UPI00211E512B|nr:proteasome subunit beta type-1-like [Schistocerca gregaria]